MSFWKNRHYIKFFDSGNRLTAAKNRFIIIYQLIPYYF